MLYDQTGNRKYLTPHERRAFIEAAKNARPEVETFCLTLAYTGARISEALALVPQRIDFQVEGIVFECLKRREAGIFRTVPVPDTLLKRLDVVHRLSALQAHAEHRDAKIWKWCRTTAWQRVKDVMLDAGISDAWAMPKALRHGFGVEGTVEAGVPLNIMQRWLGHARIETTAIYANAVGKEERALAARLWTDTTLSRRSKKW